MKPFPLPVRTIGPGSQPDEGDGTRLDYLTFPAAMEVYRRPPLPEPEQVTGLAGAHRLFDQLQAALAGYRCPAPAVALSLNALSAGERAFVSQALGEGEVSVRWESPACQVHAQETALTGVWRVQTLDATARLVDDALEVAEVPTVVRQVWTEPGDKVEPVPAPAGLINAPALLEEIQHRQQAHRPGREAHVINLSLLPLSESDDGWLRARLGQGPVAILSRGYGNCRITATATPWVWWVQYFNSMDTLILNTLEVVDVPRVACAAPEDLEDSTVRLGEILEAYR